jgi:TolB-like protein
MHLTLLLAALVGSIVPGCAPRPAPTLSPPAPGGIECKVRGDVAAPVGDASRQADTRPGIAVFPFVDGGSFGPDKEDFAALSVGLQQMLTTELAQNPALRVVERAALKQLMDEQTLGASGRVDPQTAARLGKMVGAKYVVLGGFTDAFGTMRLDGRIVVVETTEVLRAEEVRDKREQIFDMVVRLSDQVTKGVKLAPLSAQARQVRNGRAKKLPAAAAALYSRALVLQDHGRKDKAVELYREIVQRFPEMNEAREALRQLTGR